MSRTYGTITLEDNAWRITAEPHIIMRMKRVFERIDKGEHGSVTLANTPDGTGWCRGDREQMRGLYQYLAESSGQKTRQQTNLFSMGRSA